MRVFDFDDNTTCIIIRLPTRYYNLDILFFNSYNLFFYIGTLYLLYLPNLMHFSRYLFVFHKLYNVNVS